MGSTPTTACSAAPLPTERGNHFPEPSAYRQQQELADLKEQGRAELVGAFTALHDSPEWRDALTRNGWDDAFLPAEDFGAFLNSENERVAGVLRGLGLTK